MLNGMFYYKVTYDTVVFQMFPMRKLRNLTLVQFLSNRQYATNYGVEIFKGRTASLSLLVYFETAQKATVSTAGAEIVNV